MATQERDPRAYELMTVFIPDLTDEDSQAEIEKIEGLVAANGGTMTETLTSSPWGRRRLAYTVRYNGVDYRDGIYTVFHFDMAPSALAELEREMKLDTSLMRYLLVHNDPKAGEKSTGEPVHEVPVTEETGRAAGGATATAAAEATSTDKAAPADTTTPVSETTEPEPAESAPADETSVTESTDEAATTEAAESEAPADEPAAAAESAPVEDAPAKDTTTDTAPPAADEASSDDDKE